MRVLADQMMTCTKEKFVITSPIGDLILEQCQNGLHSISQTVIPSDLEGKSEHSSRHTVMMLDPPEVEKSHNINETIKWFVDYFNDPSITKKMEPPKICQYSIRKDTFRGKVRLALMENVKAGETITYQKLAEMVGNKGASRAVGTAMSNNPLSILVPCHRVIKSDGRPGNYGKSTRNQVKQWLLEFEGAEL
ncbi:methylated-DNA--protein-cysteine methyltransferase-like [Clytia hemisphaerica]|uniref:Methylated-DNA--protein-cysteine methyltransferase n=1 Tax=Clytia hemisphaerica TaxID=252671 RepID=A0A7M6DNZ7_9CNID